METRRLQLKGSILSHISRRAFFLEPISLLAALLFARVDILGGLYPMGIALVAAMDMAGLNIYFPLSGAIIGSLLSMPGSLPSLTGCFVYAAAGVIYMVIKRQRNTKMDKLLLLVITQIAIIPLYYLASIDIFIKGLALMALVILLTIAFQNGLRVFKSVAIKRKLHDDEQFALCAILGVLALSVSGVSYGWFSLGIVIISFIVIFLAYAKGFHAVAAAVALSGIMAAGAKADIMLIADMAVCALAAVMCSKTSRAWGSAAAFFICAALTGRYIGITGKQVGAVNAAIAALAMAAVPKNMLLYMLSLVDDGAREERVARLMLKRLQNKAAEDIQLTANTVVRMASLFPSEPEWGYDKEREYEEIQRAVYNLCADCVHRGACWKEPRDTLIAVEKMLPDYEAGLRPRPVEPMHGECMRTLLIASAAILSRDEYRRRLSFAYHQGSRQAFARRQLQGIGMVMNSLSDEIMGSKWPDENASQLLKKRLQRDGLSVSNALVQRNSQGVRAELRLQHTRIENHAIEEKVSRAVERPMRLLKFDKNSRQQVLEFESAGKLKGNAAYVSRPKAKSANCGDTVGQKSLTGGRELYVLSDGMGSGSAASEKSNEAVSLMLKLYEAGFERDSALECVNRLLISQSENDMYVTLDALYVDLNTGDAEFIKFGAPPTFVLRNGYVHTVYAEALPAGILDEATPAVNTAALKQNDVVVLISDGVLDALGESIKSEILRCVGGANTVEEAAISLIDAAREYGENDDMTAYIIRLE